MKFDLHIHSYRSQDSFSSIKDIIKYARKVGLSGIAITDHGALLDENIQESFITHGVWIIRGIEISTEIGDILGLFISEPLRTKEADDVIRAIHDQDGLAVLAHPFKRRSFYPSELIAKLDAIETVNARWKNLSLIRDDPALNELLSIIRGRSAGSDAHFPFEVGRAYLETPYIEDLEELKQLIISGNGVPCCEVCAPWLDFWSQSIKFYKDPSLNHLTAKIKKLLGLSKKPRSLSE